MQWWYRLHELPRLELHGMFLSLLRWADLPCFHTVVVQAKTPEFAEHLADALIENIVVYNALLRGPFTEREEAVKAAKKEFDILMSKAKQEDHAIT